MLALSIYTSSTEKEAVGVAKSSNDGKEDGKKRK
jgi:hypothetical protein